MTECVNESKKVKVIYQVDFNTNPKQLDIKFIDLTSGSIKRIISMIFEIIDRNHIRLAVKLNLDNKRSVDFSTNNGSEISILTRYLENDKYNKINAR